MLRMYERYKTMIPCSFTTAIDGDHWTGWRDMTATNQYSGQWFQVDVYKRTMGGDNGEYACSSWISNDRKH